MEIISDFTLQDASVVTIGNFDGCHRGHRYLLTQVVNEARTHNYKSLVITFASGSQGRSNYADETPAQEHSTRLFTTAQKLSHFAEIGIDFCIVQEFDAQFSAITHQEFVSTYLCEKINTRQLVVGENFRFGHARRGTVSFLKTQSRFTTKIVPTQTIGGHRISSSTIRNLIATDGDMQKADTMLGSPYTLEGKIVRGKQQGKQLGIPTANLGNILQLIPKQGVYAGYASLKTADNPMLCVINIGTRPTFSPTDDVSVEVHIIDKDFPDLYDEKIFVQFHRRLRTEKKFADRNTLVTQIHEDISQTKQLLAK